jgi:hypothetical protein
MSMTMGEFLKRQRFQNTMMRVCQAQASVIVKTKRAIRHDHSDIRDLAVNNRAAGRSSESHEVVPREVLAERDARMALAPASTTAALMGDPVLSRSALYQKKLQRA